MNKITVVLAALIFAVLGARAASAVAPFPFDADAPVVPAIAHPQWANLAREQGRDQAAIDACLAQAAKCPAHLLAYRAMVLATTNLTPTEQLQAVHQFVDAHWQAGAATGLTIDHRSWRSLGHFLRAGGGRDDVAIAKYFALRQLGFETDALRIVIPYAAPTDQTRPAVLAVALDGHTWLLGVGDVRATEQLAPDTYAINENFWWHRALFGSGGRRSISL